MPKAAAYISSTIVPYNLNEYGSNSQYEVDLSEVELLKTTEKPVVANEDEKNIIEDRKVKRRDDEDKEKDKRQRNRKGKQKGRNHSSKYSFQICGLLQKFRLAYNLPANCLASFKFTIKFFTFNKKLPEMEMLASNNFTAAKQSPTVCLDLMTTGSRV